MAIVQYDTNPDLSVDEKLQSLVRSVQLALNEKSSGAGGAGSIGGLSQAQLKKLVDTQIKARNQEMYIVGTILSNTTGQNPAEYLGFGTWVEWGKGKVPVGVDTSDPTFATSELQGGSKNAPMLKHSHDLGNHSHTIGNHTHQASLSVQVSGVTDTVPGHTHTVSHRHDLGSTKYSADLFAGGGLSGLSNNSSATTTKYTSTEAPTTSSAGEHGHSFNASGSASGQISGGSGNTGNAGGNTGTWGDDESALNLNLQPYITCYMWKRTA